MFYRTRFAPHSMTVPLLGWNPPSSGHVQGTLLNHDGAQIDAADFLDEWADITKGFWPASVTLGEAIIYTMDAAVAPAIPRAGHDLATVGTNTNTGWDEATQITITERTSLFHKTKYVFLDSPSDNDFNKYTSQAGLSSVYTDFIAYTQDSTKPVCGRDRGQPNLFVSLIIDLNDGLREEYRLS
jgi:hypothetical protein